MKIAFITFSILLTLYLGWRALPDEALPEQEILDVGKPIIKQASRPVPSQKRLDGRIDNSELKTETKPRLLVKTGPTLSCSDDEIMEAVKSGRYKRLFCIEPFHGTLVEYIDDGVAPSPRMITMAGGKKITIPLSRVPK